MVTHLCWVTLLLLPVAAATGWWVRSRAPGGGAKPGGHGRRGLTQAYLRSLNFVLNEQPDRGLDDFIKNLPVDADTVETHLALGNLFRRRGEIQRAIRVHQNLIARPNLERRHRNDAVMALGLDFFQAGVLDRAEAIFKQLADVRETRRLALGYLLDIYRQEKEWQAAIDTSQHLAAVAGESHDLDISHYYCELAEQNIAAGQLGQAQRQLARAADYAPNRVRPKVLAAELAVRRNDYRTAMRQLRTVLELDSGCLGLVADDLRACFTALEDRDGYIRYLTDLAHAHPDHPVVLQVVKQLAEAGEWDAARALVEQELAKGGSFEALEEYLEMLAERGEGVDASRIPALRRALRTVEDALPRFVCGACGFIARRYHWQCPQCGRWETLNVPGSQREKLVA